MSELQNGGLDVPLSLSLGFCPEAETSELVQVELLDNAPESGDKSTGLVDSGLDLESNRSWLSQWLGRVTPYLAPGGKPVALILSLGIVSIPLLLSGSVWVAPILAFGATTVAVLSCD